MTPFSLNPQPHGPSFPLTDHQIEDQNQFFVSPTNQDSSSLSSRSSFNILDQTQNRQIGELRHDQEDEKPVLHGGSSNHQVCPTSSVQAKFNSGEVYSSFYKLEEGESKSSYESLKWMPSKMRLMRKMMTPTNPEVSNINHTQRQENSHRSPANGNSTTRVCSDCNTTSTPLWRSGPKGPKSLCNACGIRQRKARRAMAEAAAAAANGEAASTNASWTKRRVHSKEKKPRTNHFALQKHKGKPANTAAATSQEARKLDFKGFALSLSNNEAFQQVFHRDEVAEAALLLIDLSCGFVHI